MELEEMKNTWARLSDSVEKQDARSNKILEKVIRQNYHSKLNRIGYPEFIGTIICYSGAAYVSVHLTGIEEIHLQVLAILAVGLLLIIPIISLQSVRALKRADTSTTTYLETINNFGKQKIRFRKLQRINVALGLLLMLLTLPVLSAIQGKDFTQVPYMWTVIAPLFLLVVVAFAYWVLKSYDKTLNDMENMLSEINK